MDITQADRALAEAIYLYPARDERNDWVLPLEYPGYEPKVSAYVYVRKVGAGGVQRGLLMSVAHRTTPAVHRVVDIIPAHDVEVTGGTAHQATLYVCQNLSIKRGMTLKVPAFRLVAADAPSRAREAVATGWLTR